MSYVIQIIEDALEKRVEPVKLEKKQAAVILPIVEKNDGLRLFFEKRVDNGSLHGGQISFPGGSIEPNDKSIEYAALRETEEEIGIDMHKIRVLGALKPTITLRSDFVVYPFVGVLYDDNFRINRQEIEDLFDIPLDYLMEIHPFETRFYTYKGKKHKTFIIEYKGETVWGATARITDMFINKVKERLKQGGRYGL